ncbi:mitochondrial inner membrane protein OXA1-like isoform X2 [Euphorbia lathyris]|uniref:mitochondrial inner membrane protein OXA1-like isoform X2 n=1 Tax=Euphorbia lathyris TaxID=212925 RepID=UPI0033141348
MAYIRSLSTRANLLTRRCHPSFGYVLHREDDTKHDSIPKRPSSHQGTSNFFTNSSLLGRRCIDFSSLSPTIGIGASFSRQMSTTIGEGTDKIELIADVLSDTTVQAAVASQGPALNEVAIAAADSFFPAAVLQHFIDAVHSFTGLNWWASIALTTILVRVAVLPLVVNKNQQKVASQLEIVDPLLLAEILQKMQDGRLAVYDADKQTPMHMKVYSEFLSTEMKGLCIKWSVFICFFLAISNMAEKVPSFKTGGAYWFLDLSTPDTLYIFPVLTALTFWIDGKEYQSEKGQEGISAAMKIMDWGFAALTVLFTMGFPKAIFCCLLTSNLFSRAYYRAIKVPWVYKFLGLSEMPVTPPASSSSQNSTASQNLTASPPVESTSVTYKRKKKKD